MKRLVKILGTVIFSLIIIIAIGGYLFVRNFDLNQYKSYVEDIVAQQFLKPSQRQSGIIFQKPTVQTHSVI